MKINNINEYNQLIENIQKNNKITMINVKTNHCSYSECGGHFPPEYMLQGYYTDNGEFVEIDIDCNIPNSILEEIINTEKEIEFE